MFVIFFLLSHFMTFLSPRMTIKCCPKAGDESLQHLQYHRIDKSKSICSPSDKLGVCVEGGWRSVCFGGGVHQALFPHDYEPPDVGR